MGSLKMMRTLKTDSWFDGYCKKCGSNVVVCQSKTKDYFYYCSQKNCENHQGKEIFDDEDNPDFVTHLFVSTTNEDATSNKP